MVRSAGKYAPLQAVVRKPLSTKWQLVIFDLLLLNADFLGDFPLARRRQLQLEKIPQSAHICNIAHQVTRPTRAEVEALLSQAVLEGTEGLVIKDPQSRYLAGERTPKWISLKRAFFNAGVADTFDLVVVGVIPGQGKRSGTYGSLLLATAHASLGKIQFELVTKCGQGFSETDLKSLFRILSPLVLPAKDPRVQVGKYSEVPLWVSPAVVVEIKGLGLTKSPKYPNLISVRSPVFLRSRPDKAPDQALTTTQLLAIFRARLGSPP